MAWQSLQAEARRLVAAHAADLHGRVAAAGAACEAPQVLGQVLTDATDAELLAMAPTLRAALAPALQLQPVQDDARQVQLVATSAADTTKAIAALARVALQ